MVLDIEKVWAKFLLYSGESPEGSRETLCRQLCEECADEVWAEACDAGGNLCESYRGPLESLAAADAFYQLVLTEEAVTPGVVTTPEIKLELAKRSEKARALAIEKRRACVAVLGAGFYFSRI